MILTLTPNPSIDRTVALDSELSRGQVHRVASVTSQAGGKGVNISRAAVSADIPSIAVVPAAKDDAFVLELLGAGIDCRPVRPAGDVRVNLTITEPDGTTTKLNSPGAAVLPLHLERRPPRRPASSSSAASEPSSQPWVATAPCSSRPRAPGTRRHPPPQS
jgi:1-phosphofructokinase